jgi:hypothetical protein
MCKINQTKTNKTEDTNKLTLLAFKIIAIFHNTLLAMFINFWKLSTKASFLGIDRRTAVTRSWIAATSAKLAPFMTLFRRGNRKKFTHRTPLMSPAGARLGEYGGWTYFCFPA